MRFFRRFWMRLNLRRPRGGTKSACARRSKAHLPSQTEEDIRAGLPPSEARRQAALRFGGVEATKERYRKQRGSPSLENVIQDSRHALRRRMAPTFTLRHSADYSVGIGATTSIFTLVDAVLLKSLPVANAAELLRLGGESHCCYFGGYSQNREWSIVSHDLYTNR